jgi:hypothetical protein
LGVEIGTNGGRSAIMAVVETAGVRMAGKMAGVEIAGVKMAGKLADERVSNSTESRLG